MQRNIHERIVREENAFIYNTSVHLKLMFSLQKASIHRMLTLYEDLTVMQFAQMKKVFRSKLFEVF